VTTAAERWGSVLRPALVPVGQGDPPPEVRRREQAPFGRDQRIYGELLVISFAVHPELDPVGCRPLGRRRGKRDLVHCDIAERLALACVLQPVQELLGVGGRGHPAIIGTAL